MRRPNVTGCWVLASALCSMPPVWVKRGAEADHVAVRVLDSALVHPPLCVLWLVDVHARSFPLLGKLVCVVDKKVGRACPPTGGGHDAQVDLDAVSGA